MNIPNKPSDASALSLPIHCFWNDNLSLPPHGLPNRAAQCWWNSLLQALQSCTSFTHYIKLFYKQTSAGGSKQSLGICYRNYIHAVETKDIGQIVSTHNILFNRFSEIAKQKKNTLDFVGQEGVVNGLSVFLECFNDEHIYKLFNNRYMFAMTCENCNKTFEMDSDESIFIDICDPRVSGMTADVFNDYVKCHEEIIDEIVCVHCQYINKDMPRIAVLVKVNEILPIWFHKSIHQSTLPNEIKLKTNTGGYFIYKKNAMILHFGGINGGHYRAYCLGRETAQARIMPATRRGGVQTTTVAITPDDKPSWYLFDDSVFQKREKEASIVAPHMVFYHLDRYEHGV